MFTRTHLHAVSPTAAAAAQQYGCSTYSHPLQRLSPWVLEQPSAAYMRGALAAAAAAPTLLCSGLPLCAAAEGAAWEGQVGWLPLAASPGPAAGSAPESCTAGTAGTATGVPPSAAAWPLCAAAYKARAAASAEPLPLQSGGTGSYGKRVPVMSCDMCTCQQVCCPLESSFCGSQAEGTPSDMPYSTPDEQTLALECAAPDESAGQQGVVGFRCFSGGRGSVQ